MNNVTLKFKKCVCIKCNFVWIWSMGDQKVLKRLKCDDMEKCLKYHGWREYWGPCENIWEAKVLKMYLTKKSPYEGPHVEIQEFEKANWRKSMLKEKVQDRRW